MSSTFLSSNIYLESSINGGRRCAACKYLRRRCSEDCILAPYFHHSQPDRFVHVHKIFGASNVARMLQQLPVQERGKAADAIASEAYMRVQDPIYGGTAVITRLQHEIQKAQDELARLKAQIAIYRAYQQQPNLNPAEPNNELAGLNGEAHWAFQNNTWVLPDLPNVPQNLQ